VIPPEPDDASRARRLRSVVALEIARIVEDLEARRDFLVQMWSLHRDRGPFLDTMQTRWRTLPMADLLYLDDDALVWIESFHRELDELRLYMRFTQDMPVMLSGRYDWMLRRLASYGQRAVDALGGAPTRPTTPESLEHPDASLLKYTLAAPAASAVAAPPPAPHPADSPEGG
jgi:hypothetical protein